MTLQSPPGFVPYARVLTHQRDNAVRRAEVPVEHSVSLPLPTLRWSVATYACFSGPAVRTPGRPLVLHVPDRWWLSDARRDGLVLFARTDALPFSGEPLTGPVTVSPTGRSIAETQEDLKRFGELMDLAAPAFFAGDPGDAGMREDLRHLIGALIAREVGAWYRALVPDLFVWLGE